MHCTALLLCETDLGDSEQLFHISTSDDDGYMIYNFLAAGDIWKQFAFPVEKSGLSGMHADCSVVSTALRVAIRAL